MNIKSLAYKITPIERDSQVSAINKSVKSESSSADRDPNGQRQRDKDKNAKDFLNDEEMQNVLEKLKNFPGVRDNNLTVKLVVNEIARYVVITDALGKTVRRIPESELWPLIQEKENDKGHLIDKAG